MPGRQYRHYERVLMSSSGSRSIMSSRFAIARKKVVLSFPAL